MTVSLLDYLFPKFCVSCGKWGKYFCRSCAQKIFPITLSEAICPMCGRSAIDGMTHPRCRTRHSLDGLISFFHYQGPMKAAVKAIKYRYTYDVVQSVIEQVSPSILESSIHPQVSEIQECTLSPIPLHSSRLKERGFNQSAYLGEKIAERIAVPFLNDVLIRTIKTIPQVQMLHRKERLANMRRAFVINAKISNKLTTNGILLFDDVFTTGATMREAGSVLKRAGYNPVYGMSLAR